MTSRRGFLSYTARAGAAVGAAAWIAPVVSSVSINPEAAGTAPPSSRAVDTTMAAPVTGAGTAATTSTTTPSTSTTVAQPQDDGLPFTGASIAATIAAGGAAVAGGKALLEVSKRRKAVAEGTNVDPEAGDSG